MKPFLIQAIENIRSKHKAWEEVVVILPSKRAGVYFNNYLLTQINKIQVAPKIYSIEEFVASLSSLKIASQTHQLFTLYQVYVSLLGPEDCDDFAAFLSWGNRLISDFNDLDAYRVNPEDILTDLGEFYRISAVFSDASESSFSPRFWSRLPELYKMFESALLEDHWGTLGMLYKDTLDTLEIYLAHTTKTHYFIGFNALNKAEQDLLQGFLVEQKGDVIWDLDQHFYKDRFHAAGRFIRDYQENWPYYRQNPEHFNETSFSGSKKIKAVGLPGNIAQAQYVGKLLENERESAETIAVILGNEQLLLPVLAHLPVNSDHWNVTMGHTVEELPITQWFFSLITLKVDYTEAGFNRDSVLRIFRFSPFHRWASTTVDTLDEWLEDLASNYSSRVSIERLSSIITSPIGDLLFRPIYNSKALIQQLNEVLEQLTREANLFDSMSRAVLDVLKELLAQIAIQLDAVSFDVSLAAFFRLLKESIGFQTLDFKGDPIHGIQLMGMLESRVLDFDRLIITNVNEGILPVGKNDQSFFPFSMKKKYGLPTFLDNDAIYTYHFYRLLQRAKEIYLLYNSKSEGLNAGEKSRFIRQLELLKHTNHVFEDEQSSLFFPEINAVQDEVVKTNKIVEHIGILAQRGFSPTSLTTYLNDPMVFYERYVLGIKDMDMPEKVMSALIRGNIVHDCVEQLYTPYLGKVLCSPDYDKMLALVPEILAALYANMYPKTPRPKGENYLILKAYERGIKQFLKGEQELVAKGNELIVLALEKEFNVLMEDIVEGQKVNIRGKIDRVDRYNGVTRLLDYKTGKVEKNSLFWYNWEDFTGNYKKNPLFQLLLYAWAFLERESYSSVEIGIISFKSPKAQVMPMVRKNSPFPVEPGKVDKDFALEFRKYLSQLIRELFDLEKSFVSLGDKVD